MLLKSSEFIIISIQTTFENENYKIRCKAYNIKFKLIIRVEADVYKLTRKKILVTFESFSFSYKLGILYLIVNICNENRWKKICKKSFWKKYPKKPILRLYIQSVQIIISYNRVDMFIVQSAYYYMYNLAMQLQFKSGKLSFVQKQAMMMPFVFWGLCM